MSVPYALFTWSIANGFYGHNQCQNFEAIVGFPGWLPSHTIAVDMNLAMKLMVPPGVYHHVEDRLIGTGNAPSPMWVYRRGDAS